MAAFTVALFGWLAIADVVTGQPLHRQGKALKLKDFYKTYAVLEEPIAMKHFAEKFPMTLEQFLTELEKQLPADKKLKFQIDQKAFGDEVDVAKTKVKLPTYLKKMSVATMLKLAISQVPTNNASCDVAPGLVRVTTEERFQLWDVVHDVTEVVKQADAWRPYLKPTVIHKDTPFFHPGVQFGKDQPTNATELVAKLVVLNIDPHHWNPATVNHGSVTIVNEMKLAITTASINHGEIADLLHSFLRLADLAVMMQAELFEVDQCFMAYRSRLRSGARRIAGPCG